MKLEMSLLPWRSSTATGQVSLGRDFDDLDETVAITAEQLAQGCYVEGDDTARQTGLLHDWCVQWAEAGLGFCYVHPRGPAPRELLARLPEDRLDDVVWIDYRRTRLPDDLDVPALTRVALNPFDGPEAPIDAADLVTDPVAARVSDSMAAFSAKEDLFDWDIHWILSTVLPWLITDEDLTQTELATAFSHARYNATVDPIVGLAPEGEQATARTHIEQAWTQGEGLRWAAHIFRLPFDPFPSNPLFYESTYELHRAVTNDRIVLVTGALPEPDPRSEAGIDTIGTHLLVGTVVRRLWEALQSQPHEGPPYPLVLDGIPELMSKEGDRLEELLEHGRETPLALVMRGRHPEAFPGWAQLALADHVVPTVVGAEQEAPGVPLSLMRADLDAVDRYHEAKWSGDLGEGPLVWRITSETGLLSGDPAAEPDIQPAVAREPPPRIHSPEAVGQAITASVERYGGIARWLPEETLAEAGVE